MGKRVLIPFGAKKIYTGIVQSLHTNEPEGFLPKEIISVLDAVPILPAEQFRFWDWLADYYMCPIGDIYRFAFPASLKLESETYLKLRPNAEMNYEILDANEIFLIQALEVRQVINLKEIESFIPKKEIIKTINSLIDLQYIEIDEKVEERYKSKEVAYIKLSEHLLESNHLSDIFLQLKNSPKQKELLVHIISLYSEDTQRLIQKSEVMEKGTFTHTHLKGLVEKNIVQEYYLQKDRLDYYEGETEEVEHLSPEQQRAKNEIDTAFSADKNVLLHGVTASGKTHIFLQKIEDMMLLGKNVLVLLPEISLAKQITQRLEKKYGKILGYYHQKLTDFERVEVWKKVRNNELRIVIGTRSALFLPYQNLGLVVIDEEHDTAYKPKEVTPFFSGRDAGLYLANLYNARVILSSATPSVEMYYLAMKGKLQYIPLGERFGKVALPKIEVIDFKENFNNPDFFSQNFTQKLYHEVENNLHEKNQILIMHNKRGYSNVVECESCGYVAYCPNCDVVMTYHKTAHELKCHYCGTRAAKPMACPRCHSQKLNEKGVGVEQVFEEATQLFPSANIDRMDADSMRGKFAYEKLYEKIENHQTDIVVGTQMISKGLDFDRVELVAIPRADRMLYVQDFRAEEKAYQLIVQASGRAGRKSGQGKVLIQTYQVEHPVFQLIKKENPEEIYHYFLAERKKFYYPPFVKLIQIELKHRNEKKAEKASTFLANILRKYLPEACVLGAEKAPIARLNTYYQYQILLKLPKGKNYGAYKDLVRLSLQEFAEVSAYTSVKKKILVDI